jgi:hypothetical protein
MRDRTRSHGEFRIAFENLHLEFWRFSIFPKAGSKFHAIAESTSIRMVTAFEGARNATNTFTGWAVPPRDRGESAA